MFHLETKKNNFSNQKINNSQFEIIGPKHSGKTRFIERLKEHFDCKKGIFKDFRVKKSTFDEIGDPSKHKKSPCDELIVFFVFDAQNPDSFLEMNSIYQKYGAKYGSTQILVGTKADEIATCNEDTPCPYQEARSFGENFSLQNRTHFVLVSSEADYGFEEVLKLVEIHCTTQCTRIPMRIISIDKPVIYFYPPKETDLKVELTLNGKITHTYPKPLATEEAGGLNKATWEITARPSGEIINKENNKTFSYIFWEGQQSNFTFDFSKGFVVEGPEIEQFLEEKLEILGLSRYELTEFVTFWLPRLEKNDFNLISFQGERYTSTAQLKISPSPDNLIRVYMAVRRVSEKIPIPEQNLDEFRVDRNGLKGFTVVEWGGGFN